MPITLKKQEVISSKVIDTAKISEININVKLKRIAVVVEYGSIISDQLKIEDKETILIISDDFNAMASSITTGNKTIYEELANVTYGWLLRNNKLKYKAG